MTPRPIHPALRPALATRLTRHGLTPEQAQAHLAAFEAGGPASIELARVLNDVVGDVVAAVRPTAETLTRGLAEAADRVHAVYVKPFLDWLPNAVTTLNQRTATDIADTLGRPQ